MRGCQNPVRSSTKPHLFLCSGILSSEKVLKFSLALYYQLNVWTSTKVWVNNKKKRRKACRLFHLISLKGLLMFKFRLLVNADPWWRITENFLHWGEDYCYLLSSLFPSFGHSHKHISSASLPGADWQMDTDFYQIFISQDGIELHHLPIIYSDTQGFFFF